MYARQFYRVFLREVSASATPSFAALTRQTANSHHAMVTKATTSFKSSLQSLTSATRWQADGSLTVIQRSIVAAAAMQRPSPTAAAAKFASQAPPSFIPGNPPPAAAATDTVKEGSDGSTGGALTGESEDDEEGVLPYRRRPKRKRARYKGAEGLSDGGDETGTHEQQLETSSLDSVGGGRAEEPVFHLIKSSHRRQRDLPAADSKFLWRRAEGLATARQLARVRLGARGLCPEILDEIGEQLRARELVRVEVSAGHDVHVGFLEFMLPALLDCAIIKVKGHGVTVFRDATLPPARRAPAADAADASAGRQLAASLAQSLKDAADASAERKLAASLAQTPGVQASDPSRRKAGGLERPHRKPGAGAAH